MAFCQQSCTCDFEVEKSHTPSLPWVTMPLSRSLLRLDTPGVQQEDIVVTPLRRDCKERRAYALCSNQPISHLRLHRHRLTKRVGSRDKGAGEHAHEDRSARYPDGTWLRSCSIQDHAHKQTQRPTRERRNRDIPEALHVDMRQYNFPQPHRPKQMEVLRPTLAQARAQRVERRRARRFDLSDLLCGLAKTPILREQRHDARDAAHGASEERARARVDGEVHAALLQVTYLVSCAVDLARETHD